ncbi:predicted transcriptional regulator [Pelotomaculum thermopropionicum SI]|uniref:Predicted transcriptional regulator n=1 Tax=Pelotomaculum thermopropionicum (strain DSM 13744 / JCM 10971 / SI) TaxID=370438 RepID=A5D4T9_PELTS|nr:predicted transcriptional regulator [Pelotomaculum thermopropionicum SI]
MKDFPAVLKAMADETRFQILNILLEHDFCVGALAKKLSISEAAVSQHLQILRKAGLVNGEKRGYYTHYWVDREALKQAAEEIRTLAIKTGKRDGCRKGPQTDRNHCSKENGKDI